MVAVGFGEGLELRDGTFGSATGENERYGGAWDKDPPPLGERQEGPGRGIGGGKPEEGERSRRAPGGAPSSECPTL